VKGEVDGHRTPSIRQANSLTIHYNLTNPDRRHAMAYWWVNRKQTYRQETEDGCAWSPKANGYGTCNVSYDNLTRSQRGNVVFSYAKGLISQIDWMETPAITTPGSENPQRRPALGCPELRLHLGALKGNKEPRR
jgi:hypothetical protein